MADTPDPSSPQIPGYEVGRKIGAGAMGAVYKARHVKLDRIVAIKVLHDKFTEDTKFTEKLYAEARAAAKLNHPNIVQAYDVGTADSHYFVMEYVPGTTVGDRLAEQGAYTEAEALKIVIQIAEALRHIHARNLVHCDIKPRNIMITKSGIVKLADMGLARATVTDAEAKPAGKSKVFGTPYYQSPEQINGDGEVDNRADIYCLGATFYHMLTGRVPFDGESLVAVLRQHVHAELVPPDHHRAELTTGVSMIVEMMMAKRREERYTSVDELLADLRAVARGLPPVHAQRNASISQLAGLEAEDGTPILRPDMPPDTRLRIFLILSVGLNIILIVILIILAASR